MADPSMGDLITTLSKALKQMLDNQKAIHADLVTLSKNIEQRFDYLHACLRDGVYSDCPGSDEFDRLVRDVADIERRTRGMNPDG